MFEPYDTHPTLRIYFHKKHMRQAIQHDLTRACNQHFRNQFVTNVILVTIGKTRAIDYRDKGVRRDMGSWISRERKKPW